MTSPKPPKIDVTTKRSLTKLLLITKTKHEIATMTPAELAKLIAVTASDVGLSTSFANKFGPLWKEIQPPGDLYEAPTSWFIKPISENIDSHVLAGLIKFGVDADADFETYLECLCELHKRRRKFGFILERQPLATMVQVSPRALMEYGLDFNAQELASWLTWRKFFYDLDNRSAQETGYLFELILTSALGGESMSAKKGAVSRTGDATKGRQIDCLVTLDDGSMLAYELKLRVTIAASGQGRFGEELSFPNDCAGSGIKPVLVVFDPTPNPKLTQLIAAYKAVGGEAHIGANAWEHLESQAGSTMAKFLETYVRKAIDEVSRFEEAVEADPEGRGAVLLDFAAKLDGNCVILQVGDRVRKIARLENPEYEQSDDSE